MFAGDFESISWIIHGFTWISYDLHMNCTWQTDLHMTYKWLAVDLHIINDIFDLKNDITIKKENVTNKGITSENNLIVTEITGYPAFYTQMIFDKKDYSIKIKTVLNNTEGVSLIAKCEDVINFKKES